MDHETAIETNAAERYALGELTNETRDAFEEHYFECVECANSVAAGAQLAAGVRAVAGNENPFVARKRQSGRFNVPLSIAAAALVAVVGYQNVAVIPLLQQQLQVAREPRIVHSQRLVEATRGDAVTATAPRNAAQLLDFDIPPDVPSTRYACAIIDANGKTRKELEVSASEARDTVQMSIPAGSLEPGDYTLRITAADGKAVASYRFAIR